MRLGFAAFACSLVLPLTAAAEPLLDWRAPAECPEPSVARAKLSNLLARPLDAIDVTLTASVEIRRAGGSELEATISIRTADSGRKRRLRHASCEVLTHAAAVVVALAIDPTATVAAAPEPDRIETGSVPFAPPAVDGPNARGVAGSSVAATALVAAESASQTEPARATSAISEKPPAQPVLDKPAAATEESAPPAKPVPEPETSWEWPPADVVLGVSGGVGSGVLPKPVTAVFGASVALQFGDWRAALRLAHALPRHATLADVSEAGGTVALWSASVESDYRLRWSALEIPVVVGFESGVFDAIGEGGGLRRTDRRAGAWAAGYLGAGAGLRWGAWALGLRADGLMAFWRPKFALQADMRDPQPFHRPGQWGARAFLTLEVQLP